MEKTLVTAQYLKNNKLDSVKIPFLELRESIKILKNPYNVSEIADFKITKKAHNTKQ